jgi:DNA primase
MVDGPVRSAALSRVSSSCSWGRTVNPMALLPDLYRAGATAGGEWSGSCPWCGGRDRFRVWPRHPSGTVRYWCRRCERSGDGIDLLRKLEGLSFSDAAAAIGKNVSGRPTAVPRSHRERPVSPPCDTWQTRAEQVAQESEKALWAPHGLRALTYLRRRGLCDEAIRAARLGYLHSDIREIPQTWGLPVDRRHVWVPRGVVIPWRLAGSTWRLNIRRPAGTPKYIGPAGASNGLYGADGIHPGRPVILVEGEFDALAVAQEAGDLVTAVATGSTCGARHTRWVRAVGSTPIALVAFDSDEAGEQAAGWWLSALSLVRRWAPVDDPADMLEAGADVRAWVHEGLM